MPQNPASQNPFSLLPPAFGMLSSFAIPTGDELYTKLMSGIEPDLVLSQEERQKKYQGQTDEQAKERGQRYAKAFEEYQKQLDFYLAQQNAGIRKQGQQELSSLENSDRKNEESALGSLESDMLFSNVS